jgi:large subunit ribosomal protein L29
MSVAEFRTKSVKELNQELENLRREQFNLKIQNKTGQSPKPHKIREVRKQIAQVKTLMVEKEKGGQA